MTTPKHRECNNNHEVNNNARPIIGNSDCLIKELSLNNNKHNLRIVYNSIRGCSPRLWDYWAPAFRPQNDTPRQILSFCQHEVRYTRKVNGDRTLTEDHLGMLPKTFDIYAQSPDDHGVAIWDPRYKFDQQRKIVRSVKKY